MKQIAMYIILIVLCLYIGLSSFLFFFQSHLIYFPRREIIATPHDVGLAYDAVTFQTADGVELSGWYIPSANARGILLFCHGNAGNISDRLESIRIFNRLALSTFIFDYRGYGASDGKTTEKGTYLDAEAAWDYLVNRLGAPPERIVLFGRSLGGAVAAWLAKEREPAALIVESAFTSVPDLAASLYTFLPVRWLSRFQYNTREYVRRLHCPILIVHSTGDEIVPFRMGSELYKEATDPKEFLEMTGDHNTGFLVSGSAYQDGLDAFLSRWLPH